MGQSEQYLIQVIGKILGRKGKGLVKPSLPEAVHEVGRIGADAKRATETTILGATTAMKGRTTEAGNLAPIKRRRNRSGHLRESIFEVTPTCCKKPSTRSPGCV